MSQHTESSSSPTIICTFRSLWGKKQNDSGAHIWHAIPWSAEPANAPPQSWLATHGRLLRNAATEQRLWLRALEAMPDDGVGAGRRLVLDRRVAANYRAACLSVRLADPPTGSALLMRMCWSLVFRTVCLAVSQTGGVMLLHM